MSYESKLQAVFEDKCNDIVQLTLRKSRRKFDEKEPERSPRHGRVPSEAEFHDIVITVSCRLE